MSHDFILFLLAIPVAFMMTGTTPMFLQLFSKRKRRSRPGLIGKEVYSELEIEDEQD